MPITTRRSTCNRDCPDACALIATVEDGRVRSLTGDPGHPVTRGFLCFRTSHFPEQLDAANRLRTPLLRRNGRLEPASMDEALDVAAERLLRIRAESGPAAVFHYRSGGSLGLLKLVADRFFEGFGPCATKIGDICSGAGEAAQELDFGVSDSNDLFDLLHSRHIILWGKNPFVSSIHLVPLLKEARRGGATVTLVDPVRHQGATLADRLVQPKPGSDLDLALGVARVLFEEGAVDSAALAACDNVAAFEALAFRLTPAEAAARADVSEAELRALAAAFADGPAAVLIGWGLQRRLAGGATVRVLDALSAISGNLFRRGGGASFYFRRRALFDTAAIASGAAVRHVREPLFGADVLAAKDPSIRAIWVTAGNPVCMLPDSARVAEALDRTEFVVVVDPFLTDTGRRADLVLPVPTLLEDSDLLGAYGHHWISESLPLVDAPKGVLHEVELFQALAGRVGLGEHMAGTVDDYKRRLLATGEAPEVTLERLRSEGAVRNPARSEVLFEDRRVATPSGKVNLLTELPERDGGGGDYPLWLMSNSTHLSQSSQWARDPGEHLPVTLHPEAAPGIGDGELVLVESDRGSVRAILRHDPAQRRDVAILPKGGHHDRGQSANSLIPARATDIGLGAAFLDCRVRVRRP